MFKSLVKFFLPSSKKLAKIAAQKIAEGINSQTERETQIAKIATAVDKFTEYQKFVTSVLTDGRISNDEQEKIAEMLLPAIQYIMEKI